MPHETSSQNRIQQLATSFFDSVKRTHRFFHDLALTVSSKERQQIMLAKYSQSFRRLRNLFGWNSKETAALKNGMASFQGLEPISSGQRIPLHHFDIVWFGMHDSKTYALISTSLDQTLIKQWIRFLTTESIPPFLSTWKKSFPHIYSRAAQVIEGWTRPMRNKISLKEALEQSKQQNKPLFILGDSLPSVDGVRLLRFEIGPKGSGLLALSMAAYGSTLLRWLNHSRPTPASQITTSGFDVPIKEAQHAIASALLCSQFDPGIQWDTISEDESVAQLWMPSGLQQVFGRPAIPLNAQSSSDLWRLTGTLTPAEGAPVWVIGRSRERGSNFRFLSPDLPNPFSMALFQSGTSPMVRRIVVIRKQSADLNQSFLITTFIQGCHEVEQICRHINPAEFGGELLLGIDRLLETRTVTDKIGKQHKISGLSGITSINEMGISDEELLKKQNRSLQKAIEMAGILKSRQSLDTDTQSEFRRHFLGADNESPLHVPTEIPILRHVIFRIIDVLIRLGAASPKPAQTMVPDSWDRDSAIIQARRKARDFAHTRAPKVAKKTPTPSILPTLSGTRFYILHTSEGRLLSKLEYLPKLISVLFDFFMVAVKRRNGAMVLEQHLSETIAHACDLTFVTHTLPLFRTPSDDLKKVADWISPGGSTSADGYQINLKPLLTQNEIRTNLTPRIQSIEDICDCTGLNAEAGVRTTELRASCLIQWQDPKNVLCHLTPIAIVHALQPQTSNAEDEIEYWLDCLKLSADYKTRNPLRKLMGRFGAANVINELLVAAALQSLNNPYFNLTIGITEFQENEKDAQEPPPKQPTKQKDSNEGDTASKHDALSLQQAKILEAEETFTNFIKRFTKAAVRELQKDAQKANLLETQTILAERRNQFGVAEFRSLVLKALEEMTIPDQLAFHSLLDSLIPGWRNSR